MLFVCLAAGAAGSPLRAPFALTAAERWGARLRGPVGEGSCLRGQAGFASAQPRPRLALRGGADAVPDAGAGQQAIAQATDCRELVAALMSADNDVRQAAETRYNALKTESPDATSVALIQEVAAGTEEARSMAAVLARSAVPELWEKLGEATREGIKRQLLVSLETESSPNMARKLANVVGAISFAVREGGWPELIPALAAMCSGDNEAKKEMALHVLAILPHQIGDEFKQHFTQLNAIYASAFASTDSNVHVSGMRAVSSYLTLCDTPKEIKPLQTLLPAMLAAVGSSLQVRMRV